MRSVIFISIVTIYIIAFYILLYTDTPGILTFIWYLSFPVVLILLILNVLMDDRGKYPELGKEEWGYSDKNKSELGML